MMVLSFIWEVDKMAKGAWGLDGSRGRPTKIPGETGRERAQGFSDPSLSTSEPGTSMLDVKAAAMPGSVGQRGGGAEARGAGFQQPSSRRRQENWSVRSQCQGKVPAVVRGGGWRPRYTHTSPSAQQPPSAGTLMTMAPDRP